MLHRTALDIGWFLARFLVGVAFVAYRYGYAPIIFVTLGIWRW